VTVWLVGAGPGDPGLITAKGLELVRSCEALVYDALVPPELVAEAPDDALLIPRAKLKQREIDELLVELGARGLEVVRLKGGDPFVFGRGGEEAEALAAAGVPFEVVPGVSSAIAAPAYAGIPLTHRGVASSFAVVTGHECGKDRERVNWARLATAVDTLVVLMGVAALPRIARELLAHGRPPETPVALVRWGTTERQVVLTGRLDEIASRARAARLESPVVIVIGDVVALGARLAWFGRDARRPDVTPAAIRFGCRGPCIPVVVAGLPEAPSPGYSAARAVRIVDALRRRGPNTSADRSARTGAARTRARAGACDRMPARSGSARA
jgi:uroporphyrin-III C-methyltransferase